MSRLKLFKLTGALLAGKFVVGFMIGIIMAFYVEVLQHCINMLADQAHDFIQPVRYGKVSVCPLILKPPFLIAKITLLSQGARLPPRLPLRLHYHSCSQGVTEAGNAVSIAVVKKNIAPWSWTSGSEVK